MMQDKDLRIQCLKWAIEHNVGRAKTVQQIIFEADLLYRYIEANICFLDGELSEFKLGGIAPLVFPQ
jgi:hypothetical protein